MNQTRFADLIVTRWSARFMGRVFPCSIGRGGIGIKQGEGDGITPKGCFQMIMGGYRRDRMCEPSFEQAKALYAIGPCDIWSDDPKDPHYNYPLVAFNHPYSHEKLRRGDRMYDIFGLLDYNWPNAIAGKGSAIFLHIWRAPRVPTAGCVAFAQADLLWIFKHWQEQSRVVICA